MPVVWWSLGLSWLGKFTKTPSLYWYDYPTDYIIRALSFHFLSSAFVGLLFYLTLTILLRKVSKWPDHSIYRVSLWWSVSVALLVHLSIDAFTEVA